MVTPFELHKREQVTQDTTFREVKIYKLYCSIMVKCQWDTSKKLDLHI